MGSFTPTAKSQILSQIRAKQDQIAGYQREIASLQSQIACVINHSGGPKALKEYKDRRRAEIARFRAKIASTRAEIASLKAHLKQVKG